VGALRFGAAPQRHVSRASAPGRRGAEWASIIVADSLGTLARVRCPMMIVRAVNPWRRGRPYFMTRIVEAQLRAAPHAKLFIAKASDHATIIRNPDPK
jgi:hypothetical protein